MAPAMPVIPWRASRCARKVVEKSLAEVAPTVIHYGTRHECSEEVSSAGEFRPRALSEPYMSVSTHTAPTVEQW